MAYGTHIPRDGLGGSQHRLTEEEEKRLFDNAMRALESEVMSLGMLLSLDSDARYAYRKEADAMSSELRSQVRRGRISWRIAAKQAQETRNVIMEISRTRSTPVGRAIAEKLKPEGITFAELIDEKSKKLFGEYTDFHKLDSAQKNKVYATIVESSGTPRSTINDGMRLAGPAARGLIIISLAISVYTVATAEDKLVAASREAAITGAGVAGTFAGGAVAGLACGPAAPICVSIGAFVGGALAAFGTSSFW